MNKKHISSSFDEYLTKEDFKDITSAFEDLVNWQNEEIQRLKAKNDGLKSQLDFEIQKRETVEAENERLSELTCVNCGEKFLSPTCSELYEEIVQLKAENEKLKTKIFDEGLRRKTCKYYKQVCSENTQLIAYRNALEEIQNVLFPKNKLLITDSKGLLKTQEILNEVLKDE